MNNLSFAPGSLHRRLFANDGGAGIIIETGAPAVIHHDPADKHLVLAWTPTATDVTIVADGAVTVVGGTVRIQACNYTEEMPAAKLRHLRVFARRKPGSTGAIAAQVITFGGSDGETINEMGRIQVLAAAAGEDPVCDFFDQSFVNGHDLFSLGGSTPFMLALSGGAFLSGLEVVTEFYGKA